MLFKKQEVSYIHVPHYEEIAVKHLWPDLKQDERMKPYFQDEYTGGRGPNREYFYNVLNTIYPEYLSKLMTHASKQRFTAEGEDAKK